MTSAPAGNVASKRSRGHRRPAGAPLLDRSVGSDIGRRSTALADSTRRSECWPGAISGSASSLRARRAGSGSPDPSSAPRSVSRCRKPPNRPATDVGLEQGEMSGSSRLRQIATSLSSDQALRTECVPPPVRRPVSQRSVVGHGIDLGSTQIDGIGVTTYITWRRVTSREPSTNASAGIVRARKK